MSIDRRELLRLGSTAMAASLCSPALAAPFVNRTGLSPGRFIWEPSRSSDGPVLIVASLHERLVHVFRGGRPVGISTCWLGPGRKPAGVFLLNADGSREELLRSASTGRGLSWTAQALDADNALRDARAIGSVRLPAAFASLLADITVPGTVAVMAPRRTRFSELSHAGLLPSTRLDLTADPGSLPTSTILVSTRDSEVTLLRGGDAVTSARIDVTGRRERVGTHVYWLLDADPSARSLKWLAASIAGSRNDPSLADGRAEAVLNRISIPRSEASAEMTRALHRGATLIITDKPMSTALRRKLKNTVLLASDPLPRPSTTARSSTSVRFAAGH